MVEGDPDEGAAMPVRSRLALLVLAVCLASGCSPGLDAQVRSTPSNMSPGASPVAVTPSTPNATAPSGSGPAGADGDSSTATSTSGLPRGAEPVELDPADFTTEIDNPYWPMIPGTRWTYREVEDGDAKEVVVIVTDDTRDIANGITARVVRDTVTLDGELVEDTFDWYAQDGDGNVWYLGEDTAEFEDGEMTTRAGSFEAGVDGALPGIIMPGDPRPGLAYRQEYHQGEAEDNGEVLGVDELVEAPFGQFDGALLTKDTITTEPDVQEYKLYAPGVGPVLVLGVSGGGGREELVSMDIAPPGAGTGPLGSPDS